MRRAGRFANNHLAGCGRCGHVSGRIRDLFQALLISLGGLLRDASQASYEITAGLAIVPIFSVDHTRLAVLTAADRQDELPTMIDDEFPTA